MSKTLKITARIESAERTRQPLRGRNRNNQSATPVRPAKTETQAPRREYGDRPKRDFGDAPARSFNDKPRRDFGDKPRGNFGDRSERAPRREGERDTPRREYGDRPKRDFGDKPRRDFGDKPRGNFGDRSERAPRREGERDAPRREYGDRPKRDFGDKPRRDFGDKPRGNFGDRSERAPRREGERDAPRREYGDRPKRDFGDKPRRDFGDKPHGNFGERSERAPRREGERDAPRREYGDRPKRDFGDKPRRDFGDKPRGNFGDRSERAPRREGERDTPRREYGDRPKRDFGDKPRRDFGDKPRGNFGERSERAPRREVEVVLREPSAYAASRGREPRATDRDPNAGIRLSKYLTETGVCSRREADHYIEKGWVTVNGKRAVLGQRIVPTDHIQLARQLTTAQEKRMTILIHKPVGYVSGQAEDGYSPAVNLIEPSTRWEGDDTPHELENIHVRGMAPAGRLDIDSTGLLVLTQDGRIAKALIGDKSEIDKEYLVRVEGDLDDEGLALLNHGLELDGVPLRPAQVTWQNKDQLRFILTEGKKRQIRRMCELVGLHVVGLKRIRIGKVTLGDLPLGQWRYLREDETF
ncbi:pseudouridine synthase [Hydromonas duriensis]|uniref:Dual-specificity RNA pseudouridine synthase RluF n=1 Tax=Hydromonas duriensis TaxID=1527608 RepID=A0A4R6Y789_9BURK|nr:pseudouridine synthase [Hydromonas duriensis]TDR31185.1 pseudouridine synthase [Hydromonas duriensis]